MASNYDYLTGRGDPSALDLANEVVAGFVPGLGTAQALRDYKKASEDKDYLGMGLSALGSVPVVGGLAKTATLLPALLRMGKASQIAEAEKMLKQGAGHQDIWDKTGLFKYPGQIADEGVRGGTQARWGFEIPPGKINQNAIPASGHVDLPHVLEQPELYDQLPNLAFTQVDLGLPKGIQGAGGAYSHYEGPAGKIWINDIHDLNRVLNHELNHAVNAHTGQLGSTGYAGKPITDAATALEMAALLRRVAPDLKQLPKMMEDAVAIKPRDAWRHSAGERLAEADAYRSKNYDQRRNATPYFDMNAGIDPRTNTRILVPDDVSRYLGNATTLYGSGEVPEALKYLLRNLK